MNDKAEPIEPLAETEVEKPLLQLTVILPARDEERSLPGCLASLLAQSEPGFALGVAWEILVVDDASTDQTRSIAEAAAAAHSGVTVLAAPELDLSPRGGFTGKNAACWTGAQAGIGGDEAAVVNRRIETRFWIDRLRPAKLMQDIRELVGGIDGHAVIRASGHRVLLTVESVGFAPGQSVHTASADSSARRFR